jgi:hypothetical protein
MVSDGIGARGVFLIAARATCRPSRPDFRVGANALAGVRWLGCRGFAVRGVGAPTQIAKSFVSIFFFFCLKKAVAKNAYFSAVSSHARVG